MKFILRALVALMFLGSLWLSGCTNISREICYAKARDQFFATVEECDADGLDYEACDAETKAAERWKEDQEACK